MSIPLVRVHGVNDVRLDTVDRPSVSADDLLVEVTLCGICGSDLGYVGMGGLGLTQPMPLGHELVGTVSETGSNVSDLQVGDRVVINPMAAGNSIGNGGTEGGFSPLLLVRNVANDPSAALKVPSGLSAQQAAMVEPLSVALHGCHQGKASRGETAVVFGAGPIGLCAIVCLMHLGIENIVAVDLSERRLEAARELGAVAFKPGESDLAVFLAQQHGETQLMGMPLPATDLYIEATGSASVFDQIVTTAKTGGRVVVLGLHKQPVQLDLANVLFRELNIVGSMAYPEEFPEVLDLLTTKQLDIGPIISHQFPLSQFTEALDVASDAAQAIKVMIDCQA